MMMRAAVVARRMSAPRSTMRFTPRWMARLIAPCRLVRTDSAGTIEAEPGRRHLAPQSKKAWACAPNRYGDDAPGKGSEGRTPAMGIPPTCIAKEKEISEWRSLVTGIDHDYPPAAQEREVLIEHAGAAGNNESGLARPLRRDVPPMHDARPSDADRDDGHLHRRRQRRTFRCGFALGLGLGFRAGLRCRFGRRL